MHPPPAGLQRIFRTSSTLKSNHNLMICSQEQHLLEARASPVVSQGLKQEEAVGQGRPSQPGSPQPSLQGDPPAQIHLTGPSCNQPLPGTGSVVPHEIHLTPRIWWVSPYQICQQHAPGDLPRTSEGLWEKVLGGKEERPPRGKSPCQDPARHGHGLEEAMRQSHR